MLKGQSHWLIFSLKNNPGSQQTSSYRPAAVHWQKQRSQGPSEWYGPKASGLSWQVPYLVHASCLGVVVGAVGSVGTVGTVGAVVA